MSQEELKDALQSLRDEAHRLSQEKLASGEADKARLSHARDLRRRLDALMAENTTATGRAQEENSDIAAVANRYLVFLLAGEDAAAESGPSFEASARDFHNKVIDAARRVAAGTLAGEALASEVAELRNEFNAILARPERKQSGLDALLGDINMDLRHVQAGGNAPTSLRLASEIRG